MHQVQNSWDVTRRPVQLRPLEEQDLSIVCSIEKSVYEDPWSENLLRESMRAPMTHTLGVFEGEKCLAYSVYQVIFTEGHLLNLAVKQEVQKKGLGIYLLNQVLKEARDRGANSVYLEVRPSNLPGIRLYEKRGFRILTHRENYYANGESAMVMVLDSLALNSTHRSPKS